MGAVRAFPPATDLHFGLQDLRAWVVMEMTERRPIGLILLILGTAESYRDTKTKQAEREGAGVKREELQRAGLGRIVGIWREEAESRGWSL